MPISEEERARTEILAGATRPANADTVCFRETRAVVGPARTETAAAGEVMANILPERKESTREGVGLRESEWWASRKATGHQRLMTIVKVEMDEKSTVTDWLSQLDLSIFNWSI